ncbi:hypothetical protein M409DRAFT_57163 [Zasmidium cellare ATCC 36951]|uniref:Peptidase A1 domain-containing protein n=1 Tax=Zasmidium cellare ATCC 36951 TaxID=1080233 RepID=A0A6A6CD94_ZASCE|nr:uncharacterized protein M409DRAFT_57163 [Zasmidium cellare ATCC 36951]KAF2163659.1 hypothetical protein M409DRAFT_57163 [Zasmidium cellare ATCC 36951]
MARQQHRAWLLVAALFASTSSAATNNSVPAPVSIPPSEYWDGNDGQWSTFQIEVGTPSQLVRLLPSTSASAGTSIWVVLPQGCSEANPELVYSTCANSRGNLFSSNESTTWSTNRLANNGLYELDTYEESQLGLTGNADYGFDSIGLLPGSSNAIASTELIAGIATDDFWLGSLGISPLPMNFTSLDEPVSSILENLRNTSFIPSTSWAYTAGAVYRQPPVFGSLTLGGYDASRMQNSSISLPFGADQSRDLLVGLQAITYDTFGSEPLLAQSIDMFVDSMVSQMWLPLDVCRRFEEAFGLTWNNDTELYVFNDTTHAQLQAQNPSFTFTIGASAGGPQGNTTNIIFPYSAFDLNISAPYVNGSLPYFPLKRAQNSSQYTLGRVFLQEAYLVADYDRRNFTIGQALFPSNSTQDLKAIIAPGTVVNHGSGSSSLSRGAIAGIVVGVVVAVVLLIGILVYLRRRRLRQRKAAQMAELNGVGATPAAKESANGEESEPEETKPVQPPPGASELNGSLGGTELSAAPDAQRMELPTAVNKTNDTDPEQLHELAGDGIAAAELDSPAQNWSRDLAKQ